jgi:hypothetical protein
MSLSGATIPTSGGRINWQLLILAWGLSLTLSVAAAAGLLGRDRGTTQPESTQAAKVAVNFPAVVHRPPIMTFVVLESKADADALRATVADYTRDDPELVLDQKWTHYVVVETPEQERDLWLMLAGTGEDLQAAGVDLQVLDLRKK